MKLDLGRSSFACVAISCSFQTSIAPPPGEVADVWFLPGSFIKEPFNLGFGLLKHEVNIKIFS
jgi:hypothetical protein